MPLLVDYSKRRANLNPNSEGAISYSSYYDDCCSVGSDGQDSFANDCDYDESTSGHAAMPEDTRSGVKKLDSSSESNATDSTLSATSELYSDEDLSESHLETPVCFRMKRSSMGLGGSQSSQPQPEVDCTSRRQSDTMVQLQHQQQRPKDELPFRRNKTLPDRLDVKASLLQYDAWKRKQQTLLSASAILATADDRDLFQRPGRLGSVYGRHSDHGPLRGRRRVTMSHVTNNEPEQDTQEEVRPQGPLKSRSMHDPRSTSRLSQSRERATRRSEVSRFSNEAAQAKNDPPKPPKKSDSMRVPRNVSAKLHRSFPVTRTASRRSTRSVHVAQARRPSSNYRRQGSLPLEPTSPKRRLSTSSYRRGSLTNSSSINEPISPKGRRSSGHSYRRGSIPAEPPISPRCKRPSSFYRSRHGNIPTSIDAPPISPPRQRHSRRAQVARNVGQRSPSRSSLIQQQSNSFHGSRGLLQRNSNQNAKPQRSKSQINLMGSVLVANRTGGGIRRGSLDRLRTSSQRMTMMTRKDGDGNLNDFVTGSRIRRLSCDLESHSFQHNVLGYR